VVRAESKAVDCAFAIMAQARMNGPPREQLTLPRRHGGLGLAHTGPEEGDAAYLSAVATTQLAMRRGPAEFPPFDGPSGPQLCLQWEGLHDKAETLWRPEDRVVSQDSMSTIAEAQRAYCRHSAQARADALLASLQDGTEDGKGARARLLSCACRPASAWLDTLELKSGEFQTALRHRLGLAILPLNAPTVQCGCGATLHRTDTHHGMRCSALAAHFTLRHDILKGILRRAVHRAGIASTLEPPLRRLPGLAAGARASADGSAIRPEAWGNILMALPQGTSITDISVIHPLSLNIISQMATTAGAAASHRDQWKRTAYAREEPHGYGFVPFSVETYARLGQPGMKLLHSLGDEAAGPGGVTRASFVHGALRELSVGLCRGNFFAYRASVGMLARCSGASFRAGMRVPTDECVE
jgi:hypothetical protein